MSKFEDMPAHCFVSSRYYGHTSNKKLLLLEQYFDAVLQPLSLRSIEIYSRKMVFEKRSPYKY